MAPPKQPRSRAIVAGRDLMNPSRYRNRTALEGEPIGDAPDWMNDHQRQAWQAFAAELPWLNRSHRAVVEIAVTVRARLIAGDLVGVNALTLLRQCLGQMGATPADATKVAMPEDGEDDEDAFFAPRPS